jgi:hypothetical protein
MARRTRARRAPGPGQVNFNAADGQSDSRLLELAERMWSAERAHQAAMDELAAAERRLLEKPRSEGGGRRPVWYGEAVRREQRAGTALDDIYKTIARVPAHTKSGLAIKVTVLATLYGEDVEEGPDQSDLVSVMIDSLLKDVTE